MEALLVSIGGAAGAVTRYLVGQLLRKTAFPWATLIVNIVGSFILGVVIFGGSGDSVHFVVSVGFCGAFTTFSSFSFQTIRLWERGKSTNAVLNAIGNLVLSLIAFTAARLLVG